jgi:hypothetical protein
MHGEAPVTLDLQHAKLRPDADGTNMNDLHTL